MKSSLEPTPPLSQNLTKSFSVLLQKHPVGFSDFVVTSRAYGNPTQILTELVFPHITQYKTEKNVEGLKQVTQLLEEWLRTSPDDLKPKAVSQRILECTEHDKELTNKIKLALLKTGKDKHKSCVLELSTAQPSVPSPLPCTELLLSLPAEVLAATFSHVEQELYKNIPPAEIVAWYLSKDDRAKQAPNVVASIDRFNLVSRWIGYMILKSTEEKERIKLLEKFIAVARKCEILANFNTMMQIVCSLNNTMISRLHCWEKLDSRSIAEFQALEDMMSPMKNFGNYREQFKKRKPQVIPYLPITTRDVTFAFEMSKYVDDLVNWNLLNSVGFIIREFKACQSKPMKFNFDADFEKVITQLPNITEDELEKLSFLIQPSIYQTGPLGSDSDFFSKSSYTTSDSKSVCSEDDDKASSVEAPLPAADLPEMPATEPVPRRKASISSTPRKRYTYCESVRIPSKFESTFVPAEKHVKAYFNKSTRTPFRGEIRVGGQRYLAIRTDSLSNDFLRATQFLLRDDDVDETGIAGFLYQIAYMVGKADAANFQLSANLHAREHLACGFMFPAYLGNARMCLRYQSDTDKLKYIFSYTCLNNEKHQQCLHCAWTSAYSSGWISGVAGQNLQSAEVTCLCRGHKECSSILAPESDLHGEIASYINENHYAINNISADSVQSLASLKALEFQRDACENNAGSKTPKISLSRILHIHKDNVTHGKQTVEEFANWNQQVNAQVTKTLFPEMKWNVKTGTISFNNEGYFLLNSGSFFVDLYNELRAMCTNEEKATKFALSTLYEITEYMGTADCLYFARESKNIHIPRCTDRDLLISKLCALRSFFAQCGWGRIVYHFESFNTIPSAVTADTEKDLKYTLISFEVQNCCEAEAWSAKCPNQASANPTCICMSGYIAGWLTYAFGTQMVVSEVTCSAMDHDHCSFIAAIPSRIKNACSDYVSDNKLGYKATSHLEKYLKQVTFAS